MLEFVCVHAGGVEVEVVVVGGVDISIDISIWSYTQTMEQHTLTPWTLATFDVPPSVTCVNHETFNDSQTMRWLR